jgi:hypothetical protein
MATKIIAAKAVAAKRAAAEKTLAPKATAAKSINSKVVNSKESGKEELVFSHPTMCLHCHLIVEMFHERGADPVRGSWQCPRCNHKYLFSHWKIKRQSRGKTEAA